jgi:nicotinamide-nucleotide amidase
VVEAGKTLFFLLPGPPREMQPMFEHHVLPQVKKYASGIKKSFVLHMCGLGESAADEKIRPIIEAERKLESGIVDFTILAHQMLVDIKASVSGKDEMLIDETITNLRHEFREVLGDNIYGEDRQTLEGAVGDLLVKHKRTLALAESCTGGLVAQKITNVAGSSLYFRQGVVTYSNESKISLLGVEEPVLIEVGAVSAEVAVAMASGALESFAADLAVSVTGIAGPGGGTAEKPVGLVWFGLASSDHEEPMTVRREFSGSRRGAIRLRATALALDLLRREALGGAK